MIFSTKGDAAKSASLLTTIDTHELSGITAGASFKN